jgi:hypothetical protein
VTDDRPGSAWTATVSATDFITGIAAATHTIPPGAATYFINDLDATTGNATFTSTSPTILSGTSQNVVTASGATGDTSASWDPIIQVSVPATAVAGTYTATITHSVS